MDKDEELEEWLKFANKIQVAAGSDEYRLRMVQEYLATRAPQRWCPCRNGYTITTACDHMDGCSFGKLHEQEEIRLRAAMEDVRIERKESKARQARQAKLICKLENIWSDEIAGKLSPAVLNRIITDCVAVQNGRKRKLD